MIILRQDDMIEGEMFKQLGVKEEDKDADDEAARQKTLTQDVVDASNQLAMASNLIAVSSVGFDCCCAEGGLTVDDGSARFLASLKL